MTTNPIDVHSLNAYDLVKLSLCHSADLLPPPQVESPKSKKSFGKNFVQENIKGAKNFKKPVSPQRESIVQSVQQ